MKYAVARARVDECFKSLGSGSSLRRKGNADWYYRKMHGSAGRTRIGELLVRDGESHKENDIQLLGVRSRIGSETPAVSLFFTASS
jgi:hypothetical protein